jgi:uroporphyrinogen-III synthase
MTALEARTVVVTRARHQAARFAQALEAQGARVLFFPTIAILPAVDQSAVNAAVSALSGFSWIVFTSANAVAAFAGRLRVAKVAWPRDLKVAAVGPSTADALADFGIAIHAQPDVHSGAHVAGAMGSVRGAAVLLPHGDLAREETAVGLRQAGARVTEVVVYRTDIAFADKPALQQLRAGFDAITFTSPSTVRGFAAIVGDDARALVAHTLIATIGPTTSAAVREAGWGDVLEAPAATSDAMVESLVAHFGAALSARGAR